MKKDKCSSCGTHTRSKLTVKNGIVICHACLKREIAMTKTPIMEIYPK